MASLTERIRLHPFLSGIGEEHLSVMIEGAEGARFQSGQVLFREGEPASRLYFIHEGQVALETHVPGRNDVLVAAMGKGELLGWSWLVAPFVWHFQARALEDTEVTVLNGAHLLMASERDAELGYELMTRISKVILQVLLVAHKRFLETGRRPAVGGVGKDGGPAVDQNQPLETRMAAHPILHGLRPAHLQRLVELGRPAHFGTGQMVFQTGHPANNFYLIEQGQVVLEASQPSGPVLLQVARAGDALGWSSFFEPCLWHFDARAVEPTSTIAFDATELKALCAADHHFGYEFMKRVTRTILQRLQATRKRLWEAYI